MFQGGDRVVIRDWDDMAAEFGLTGVGNIKTSVHFLKEMKELCGKHGFVIEVREFSREPEIIIEFDDARTTEIANDYVITADMVRFEDEDEEFEGIDCSDSTALMSFVLGGDDGI